LPDGVIFPIMGALAAFQKRRNGPKKKKDPRWYFDYPQRLEERILRKAADLCSCEFGGQPALMGKASLAYTVLDTMAEAHLPDDVLALMDAEDV
jgi:hypothetical protein